MMAILSHMWPLSLWNVTCATRDLNFSMYLMITGFNGNNGAGASYWKTFGQVWINKGPEIDT